MSYESQLKEEIKILNKLHCIRAVDSLYYLLQLLWEVIIKDEFIDNWHIPYLCEELEKISPNIIARKPKDYDLIINIPPGTSKSTIVTIMWDVWLWLQDPTLVIINSSYAAGLSTDHGILFGEIVNSEMFNDIFQPHFIKNFGENLSFKKNTERVITNNFGGSRIVTSTKGMITGKHAHLIKRDDPINPKEAESMAYRKSANHFNDRTLSSRRKQKESTVTVTVMQRLHEEDTTGNDLNKKDAKIKHICLPAEIAENINPPELKENYVNGLLDSKRLSINVLNDFKSILGGYGYAGQFMQNPSPEEGGIIKKNWFTFIEKAPEDIAWDLWLDTAFTDNKNNDPTGFLMVGDDMINGRIIIRNFESKWMGLPELIEYIPEFMKNNGGDLATMVYVEPKASGYDVINLLKKQINVTKIVGSLVQQGKMVRAHYASPFIQSSRVVLVRGNWNDAFIHELTAFPTAAHDEAIDLIGYSIKQYLRNE